MKVGSEEFISKYVQHDTLAVATVAKKLLDIKSKEASLQDNKAQILKLRGIGEHNHLSTGDENVLMKNTPYFH